MSRNIVLMGPPLSGKGSVGIALKARGFVEFDAGAQLRLVAQGTNPEDQHLRRQLAGGNFAPDALTVELFRGWLNANAHRSRLLISGFPRGAQVDIIADDIREGRIRFDELIWLHVSDYTVRQRLALRVVCPDCEFISSTIESEDGLCAMCGQGMVRRDDDHLDGIARRLELYYQMTEPVAGRLAELGVPVHDIDAEMPFEAVISQVLGALNLDGPIFSSGPTR